jgi:CBS domain-containing protein
MITVEEIMTPRPYVMKDTDSLEAARELMTEHRFRHLPVVDASGELVGLVTQHDVLAASVSVLASLTEDERHLRDSSIELGQIMSRDVETVRRDDSLRHAATMMHKRHHGCLPVLEGGKVVGIVTDSDFVGVAISLLEQNETREVEDTFEEIDIAEDEGLEDWEIEGLSTLDQDREEL